MPPWLPAGPELRQRPPITLHGQPGVDISAPLSVTERGFSLHAATTASSDDVRGREALVRYALRPPIAQERLHISAPAASMLNYDWFHHESLYCSFLFPVCRNLAYWNYRERLWRQGGN